MSTTKRYKRQRKNGPMIDGDVDSAQVVTPRTITETKRDGSIIKKQVWESLDTPSPKSSAMENTPEVPAMGDEQSHYPAFDPAFDPANPSHPPPVRTKKSQVSLKYEIDIFSDVKL